MDHVDSNEENVVDEHTDKDELDEHALVLTEPVPQDQVEAHQADEDGQSLLQTIVMVIGAIILVILLVLFARWLYHEVHHSDQSNTGGTVQLPQESTNPNTQTQPSPNQPSNNSGGSSSSGGQASSTSQNGGKPLANTGPGNVAAVFAGSTLAAAGLHYIISLRRFSRSADSQS